MPQKNLVQDTKIKYLRRDIDNLSKKMDEGFEKVYQKIDNHLVTKEEFNPIKKAYNEISSLGMKIGLAIIVLLGAVGLFFFNWIKSKVE